MKSSEVSAGVRLVTGLSGGADQPRGSDPRDDHSAVLAANEPAAGQSVTAAIHLERILRRGGMGSLWLAEHRQLKIPVVVKFIASELAGNSDIVGRFQREAAATMAARSPHVVKIIEYGLTASAVPFLAMEYLAGEDLAAKIDREGRVPPWEFAEILKQACTGLASAHAHGIVHRDIKPENIFLSNPDGELVVKILDFGIAKSENTLFGLGATNTGAFMGTVHYMSPEQTMGAKSVDHRTDLWALGVVTYLALTGVRPFDAEAIGTLVEHITCKPIAPPSRHVPTLGPAIDRWMCLALSRDPEQRFASAEEMAASFNAAVITSLVWPSTGKSDHLDTGEADTVQRPGYRIATFTEEKGPDGTQPPSAVQVRRRPTSVRSLVQSLGAPVKLKSRSLGIRVTAVCLLAIFALALKVFFSFGVSAPHRAGAPAVQPLAVRSGGAPLAASEIPATGTVASPMVASSAASAPDAPFSAQVEPRETPRSKPKRGTSYQDNPFDGSY